MDLIFRELVNDDIYACLNIIKDIYTPNEKIHQEGLQKDLSDVLNKVYPSKFLGVFVNEVLIGFGCYLKLASQNSSDNIFYKLSWININPKEQVKGIGKKLVYELEQHIKNECKDTFSVIFETDKPDFYKRLGYDVYQQNENNYWMQKLFPKVIFPKIMIGTLFSEVKDYAIKEWFKNVCKFTYPNFDLCMVDNSKDKKYHKKMFKYFSERKKNSNIGKLTVLHTPRIDKKSQVFMTFSVNELRKHFLKEDYEWWFNLESDIIPRIDILERLLCYNKPMIGTTYFSGKKNKSYPMIFDSFVYNDKSVLNIDMVIGIIPYIYGFYEMTDSFEPKKCFSEGLGCVMIHRSIIEKIPFRSDNILKESHYDTAFYNDLFNNNIPNYLIPIVCRHENQSWDKQFKMIEK